MFRPTPTTLAATSWATRPSQRSGRWAKIPLSDWSVTRILTSDWSRWWRGWARTRRGRCSSSWRAAPGRHCWASRSASFCIGYLLILIIEIIIPMYCRTWILPSASRTQARIPRGYPQPPPAWTSSNCQISGWECVNQKWFINSNCHNFILKFCFRTQQFWRTSFCTP